MREKNRKRLVGNVLGAIFAVGCAAACANGSADTGSSNGDQGADDAASYSLGDADAGDAYSSNDVGAMDSPGEGAQSVDAAGDSPVCTLGTPDHCGACSTKCPGPDDATTSRTCSDATASAQCDILCHGEYYDLDGDPTNGCEALDAVIQDTPATAVPITLPDVVDPTYKTNPRNLVEQIYSDMRKHDAPPVLRPLGRDDYWAVTAVGVGDPNSGMAACLGITNYPADNQYQVCISDIGSTTFSPAGCGVAMGGQSSQCVTPPAMTDAGGPYYVRVHKVAGTNTPLEYALFLTH
jgi:hypothetical protein